MRLTITPADSAVYVDGYAFLGLDLSSCGIPTNVHALQWHEDSGWIEFAEDIRDDETGFRVPNEDIVELPEWATHAKSVWDAAKEQEEAVLAALQPVNQPISSGAQTL